MGREGPVSKGKQPRSLAKTPNCILSVKKVTFLVKIDRQVSLEAAIF